jgi:hypothetical protein
LQTILIGRGAGVDDVVRKLEAFIKAGVKQQAIPAFDHRHDRFAGVRFMATEDDFDPIDRDQLFRQRTVLLGIGTRIVVNRDQFPAIDAACGIDLFDGKERRENLRRFDLGRHSGLRIQYADFDRISVGHK